jgi:DNA end-binding protein Ku
VPAVWTGALSFGLVSIPVKLSPATEAKDVRFHLVDPETGRRVRFKRVVEEPAPWERERLEAGGEREPSSADETEDERGEADALPARRDERSGGSALSGERELAYDRLARGYEVEPGRMVTFEREELERARPERSRTIEIEDLVELADIDPVFFEKSYLVAPQYGAERPYVLLLRAMERTGLVGIGRFVLRTKPHLVAIRPRGDVLGLETMYFADEVRPIDEVADRVGDVSVDPRELGLAEQLIEALRVDWEPSRYADTYRDELLRMIQERTPTAVEESEVETAGPPGDVERLMEALKASVAAAKERRAGNTSRRSAG